MESKISCAKCGKERLWSKVSRSWAVGLKADGTFIYLCSDCNGKTSAEKRVVWEELIHQAYSGGDVREELPSVSDIAAASDCNPRISLWSLRSLR